MSQRISIQMQRVWRNSFAKCKLPTHGKAAHTTAAMGYQPRSCAPGGPRCDAALSCVCFTVILDDIVFPDGRTLMGVLGGGGAQV